tara:strand:+ start:249 stop:767 length:519 start_codon:yes stop_codon:yes gene_type:complete
MESHGIGKLKEDGYQHLKKLGSETVLEEGVLLFHPENISIYDNVYIGHNTILKGYYKNELIIGEGTWIGQQCFFHSAGGIKIGKNVGIGPGVKILTSYHKDTDTTIPILHEELEFKPVIIEDDSDLGVNSVIMPGVTIKKGTQVGAGAVVTKDFPEYSIIAGVPAKLIRMRK